MVSGVDTVWRSFKTVALLSSSRRTARLHSEHHYQWYPYLFALWRRPIRSRGLSSLNTKPLFFVIGARSDFIWIGFNLWSFFSMVPLELFQESSKTCFEVYHPKWKLGPLLLAHLYRGWNNLVYRNIHSFGGLPSTLGLAIFQETVSSTSSFSGKWDSWLVLNPLHSFRAASGRAVLIFFEFEAAPWFQLSKSPVWWIFTDRNSSPLFLLGYLSSSFSWI